jgi:AcrR family transcriptional regulator
MNIATGERVRRGRPRNVERRRAIVEVALHVFANDGYHGCKMRDIAREAGIGATLLYRYFRSKIELLKAVVEFVTAQLWELAEALRMLAEISVGPRPFLLAAGTVFLEPMERLHPWYAIWFSGVRLPPEEQNTIVAAQENIFRAMAAGLAGRGRWRDPYVTARTFCATLNNLMLYQERSHFEVATGELRGVFLEEVVEVLAPLGSDGAE